MLGAPSRGVWKQLDGLFRYGAVGHLGDEELLGRFVARRDEAAEAAFAALVERYGPMVLGVCRRVLGDRHEAEDAFQATFLVLARKAGSIARREQLANWLFGVACRTALDARARATRRKAREQRMHAMSGSQVRPADDEQPVLDELRAILDEELARLPERYRGAVVLCELDGLSRRAAARRLGIPEGTLSSRLARAKELLRQRLGRRGLALSALALDGALARQAEARTLLVPFSLADSTIRSATRVAAGASLAEAASTSVATLTQGVLKAMLLAKFKGIVLGLATAAVVTTGVGVMAQAPFSRTPAPDTDRLGVLERKLDRILEALGGSHRTPTPTKSDRGADAPKDVVRFPGDARPAAKDAPYIGPADAPAPKGAPYPAPNPAAAPKGMAPDTGADNVPIGKTADLAPYDPTWTRSKNTRNPGPPLGSSPALAARVDALEHRLAELERRFGEMERRLAKRGPGPATTSSRTERNPFDDSPDRVRDPLTSPTQPLPPSLPPDREGAP